MKRLLSLCMLLSCSYALLGQELKVLDFHADYMMNDAVKDPQRDANGVPCGLVKLGLVVPDATFEGDIISTNYVNGEWRIYMMKGANWITVKTQQYLPLRYDLPPEYPSIESNVTYVMAVEVPANDSTDYFLEMAAEAAVRNNMEGLIQYIEKVPRAAVPDSLQVLYNNALLVKTHNTLINSLKQRTNNFTAIPDMETFKQCRLFITKYPNSEYYKEVSMLLHNKGQVFIKQRAGNLVSTSSERNTQVTPSSSNTSNIPSSMPSRPSFLRIGIGGEPFLIFPNSSKIEYDTSIIYYGIEANAVLRIGRPRNTINGLLGVGATLASFVKPNLHVSAEIRLNVNEAFYLGAGADISLMDIGSSSNNDKVSSATNYKFMVGFCENKYDFYLGVRIIESIGGAVGIGLKWYLF